MSGGSAVCLDFFTYLLDFINFCSWREKSLVCVLAFVCVSLSVRAFVCTPSCVFDLRGAISYVIIDEIMIIPPRMSLAGDSLTVMI